MARDKGYWGHENIKSRLTLLFLYIKILVSEQENIICEIALKYHNI